MCGIQIPVALHGVRAPPEAFTLVAELDLAKIVQVSTLGMNDLAEHALADHIEDHHLGLAVVAILHHHAMSACLLRHLDELPAIVERHSCGHFRGGMLAILHGCDAHRHVPLPRRRRVDEIDVRRFAQPLEVFRPARKASRFGLARLGHPFLHQFHAVFDDVADRRDARAGHAEKIAHVGAAHATDADEADPDLRQWWRAEEWRLRRRRLLGNRRCRIGHPGQARTNDGARRPKKVTSIGLFAHSS